MYNEVLAFCTQPSVSSSFFCFDYFQRSCTHLYEFRKEKMSFPIITTENLILNEIKQEDVSSIFEIFSNDDVTKYYDLESFKTLEQAENLIKLVTLRFTNLQGIRWAIRFKESNKCIGTCGATTHPVMA